jgi:3'-5' exonuclease
MNLDNHLYLDLETIPSTDPALIERIRAEVQPPAQYKKPESIAAWMAENADAVVQERLHATGLDGLYGSICVAGFALGEDAPQLVTGEHESESELLRGFFDLIEIEAGQRADGAAVDLIVVGHNVEFDLRYLLHRAVRHRLQVPRALRRAFDPDKGRYQVRDTMKLWAGYSGRVKLKTLSHELLGEMAHDIDGKDVARVWVENPQAVADHCRDDIIRTRDVYRAIAHTLWLA